MDNSRTVSTWLEEIIERHATLLHPPRDIISDAEGGEVVVFSETTAEDGGPTTIAVAKVDALDIAMQDWLTHAHADEGRLIEEVERLKANYTRGLALVDAFMLEYGQTISPRLRDALVILQTQLRGLT